MSAATTTTPSTTPPATVPASQVVPFPLPWGGIPCPPIPGCAPGCGPAGMDALMKCYMDIKNAMAFISKVMIDLINNDPAVAQAMIAAIEKSGSTLPTIGVTNGVAAQPGQVGEFVEFTQAVPYTTAGLSLVSVSMGVLSPGDWLVWASLGVTTLADSTFMVLNPVPAGFQGSMAQELDGAFGSATALVSSPIQALTSVPSLVVLQINVSTPSAAGQANVFFSALRVR